MLIESLARLTLVNEECKERGIVINSEEFMKETDEVINQQIGVLKKDLNFQVNNPGPYSFGLGNRSVAIFPPTYTETADWAIIVYNEEEKVQEELFVFQSMYGLVENLAKAFKHIENVNNAKKGGENGPEAGSFQTDTSTDIVT